MEAIRVIKDYQVKNIVSPNENAIFGMDVEKLLDSLPKEPMFDLVVTFIWSSDQSIQDVHDEAHNLLAA